MLDEDSLFLGGRVYDVRAMAKELKVSESDLCRPVLLSTKTGSEALTLCCDKSHGDMRAPKHKPPKGFNKVKLTKDFSSTATNEQKKAAGWGGKQKI